MDILKPGRILSIISKDIYMGFFYDCGNCLRWTSFRREFGLDDLQESVPTPTILWLCVLASLEF